MTFDKNFFDTLEYQTELCRFMSSAEDVSAYYRTNTRNTAPNLEKLRSGQRLRTTMRTTDAKLRSSCCVVGIPYRTLPILETHETTLPK